MKKILLISILILAVLFVLNLFDEELGPEAQALLDRVDYKKESGSFIYLLGIVAAPDEDPAELGRSLLEEYRLLEGDENYPVAEYPYSQRLPLPEGELFCSVSDAGCLKTLFTKEFDIDALEAENRVLIERVRKIQATGEFNTMTMPSMNEPIPEYDYISRATRLAVLKAISIYKEGRTEEALRLLMNRLAVARQNMALQDTIIGKLIYAFKVSEILDVASVILDREQGVLQVHKIPPLSPEEKGFGQISAREFMSLYHVILDVDEHTEQEGAKRVFMVFLKRLIYKPNMTANAIVPVYSRVEKLSEMSPKEFAEEVESGVKPDISTSMIRNYVGHAMLEVSAPNWEEYVQRLLDLDAKIELFNYIHHFRFAADKVWNPYYEDEYSYRQGKAVCFRAPLEARESFRCLRIKL